MELVRYIKDLGKFVSFFSLNISHQNLTVFFWFLVFCMCYFFYPWTTLYFVILGRKLIVLVRLWFLFSFLPINFTISPFNFNFLTTNLTTPATDLNVPIFTKMYVRIETCLSICGAQMQKFIEQTFFPYQHWIPLWIFDTEMTIQSFSSVSFCVFTSSTILSHLTLTKHSFFRLVLLWELLLL